MTKECREMLDQIDEFLSMKGQPSRELATILSALRGNDTEEAEYNEPNPKWATMSVRMEAFPRSCGTKNAGPVVLAGLSHWGVHPIYRPRPTSYTLKMLSKAGSHFSDHVVGALHVLGWEARSLYDGTCEVHKPE